MSNIYLNSVDDEPDEKTTLTIQKAITKEQGIYIGITWENTKKKMVPMSLGFVTDSISDIRKIQKLLEEIIGCNCER